VGVGELAVLDDGDGSGGNAGLVEHLLGDSIDARLESGIEGADGLRGKSEGGSEGKKDEAADSGSHGGSGS
jgi:hypothetical protein